MFHTHGLILSIANWCVRFAKDLVFSLWFTIHKLQIGQKALDNGTICYFSKSCVLAFTNSNLLTRLRIISKIEIYIF